MFEKRGIRNPRCHGNLGCLLDRYFLDTHPHDTSITTILRHLYVEEEEEEEENRLRYFVQSQFNRGLVSTRFYPTCRQSVCKIFFIQKA